MVLGFLFVGMDKICFLERIMQEETFHVEDAHGPWEPGLEEDVSAHGRRGLELDDLQGPFQS